MHLLTHLQMVKTWIFFIGGFLFVATNYYFYIILIKIFPIFLIRINIYTIVIKINISYIFKCIYLYLI